MGKVGPNPQTNDRSSLVMDLVRSEDKTMNHSDPMRTQTCVILVTPLLSEMTLTIITIGANKTHVGSIAQVRLCALLPMVNRDIMCSSRELEGLRKYLRVKNEPSGVGNESTRVKDESSRKVVTRIELEAGKDSVLG